MPENSYDLVIVGGGPAGIAAGVYAARKKIKTLLITDTFGGQSLVSDDIGNWLGEEHISGFDLAGKLEKHLRAQKGIEIVEGDLVSKITQPSGALFSVGTEKGKSFTAKTILFVAGSRRRKLEVPGEKELEGKGVFYCATCDAPLMNGKVAVVIGGGNAGLEAVEDLLPYASQIYLIHRNDTLKGDPVTQEKINPVRNSPPQGPAGAQSAGEISNGVKKAEVKIILNAEVQRIIGEKTVTGLEYKDKISGNIQKLSVDGIFVEIGIIPNGDLVKDLVSLNFRGEIITDPKTQATSLLGIWAAGDATDGLYRQNNISAGDAVKAVLNIYDFLRKS